MSTVDDRTTDPTLDYGRAEPTPLLTRGRADVQARVDGALEFCGMVLAAVGGPRRMAVVAAVALLAGGLGVCLRHDPFNGGAEAMAVGGALLGFVLPLPKR